MMSANPVRYGAADPTEPVIHELPPLKYGGEDVPIRLMVRQVAEGSWRAKLLFGLGDAESVPATAEIFCAPSEKELWHSVHDLRDHHYRDLYRSVAE